MSHLKNTFGHRNGVLMCTILNIIKSSMEGAHLKLVKKIPGYFKIEISFLGAYLRLQEILCNQNIGWVLHTPLEMKCATTLR